MFPFLVLCITGDIQVLLSKSVTYRLIRIHVLAAEPCLHVANFTAVMEKKKEDSLCLPTPSPQTKPRYDIKC